MSLSGLSESLLRRLFDDDEATISLQNGSIKQKKGRNYSLIDAKFGRPRFGRRVTLRRRRRRARRRQSTIVPLKARLNLVSARATAGAKPKFSPAYASRFVG